jgi:hypothetical protein
MHFRQRSGELHIMPIGFGAAGGPRQAPGVPEFASRPTRYTRYGVSFLTEPAAVTRFLPDRLSLRGQPVVTVQIIALRDIAWLAGRGYNMMTLSVPVTFSGTESKVDGHYQAVMWENLTDPIITGREQLGHPKLYAEIPDPVVWNGTTTCQASWQGFPIAAMELSCREPAQASFLQQMMADAGSGLIGYKYIPRTGVWDESDVAYFTLTPFPGASNLANPSPSPEVLVGTGSVEFNRPRWRDMPTQFHIVGALADLPQLSQAGAFIMSGAQYTDFHDQTIIS